MQKKFKAMTAAFLMGASTLAGGATAAMAGNETISFTEEEKKWMTPFKIKEAIKTIKEAGPDHLYYNLEEIRSAAGYYNNEELTRAVIEALPVLLDDPRNWRDVMHHYSFIGDDHAEDKYDAQIFEVLKPIFTKYIQDTQGMKGGKELENRLYNLRVAAGGNRALDEMIMKQLPDLLIDTDLAGWVDVVRSYGISTRNYHQMSQREPGEHEHCNYTDEIYEALDPQFVALKAALESIDTFSAQTRNNLAVNIPFMLGELADASPRHAAQVVELLGPMLKHENEMVRGIAVKSIYQAVGHELKSEEGLNASTKAFALFTPLAENTSGMALKDVQFMAYAIGNAGELYEDLAGQAIDLLEKIALQHGSLADYEYGHAPSSIARIGIKYPDLAQKAADILFKMTSGPKALAEDSSDALARMAKHNQDQLNYALEAAKTRFVSRNGAQDVWPLLNLGLNHNSVAPEVMKLFNQEVCGKGQIVLTGNSMGDEIYRIAYNVPSLTADGIQVLKCEMENAMNAKNKDRYFWQAIKGIAGDIVDLHELQDRQEREAQKAPTPKP